MQNRMQTPAIYQVAYPQRAREAARHSVLGKLRRLTRRLRSLPKQGVTALMLLSMAIATLSLGAAARAEVPDPQNTLVIELKSGRVLIKLRPDLAPKHVARVKQLAREGFYNGLKFHRVIAGFMAQTGDPTGTGTGNSRYPNLPAEFSSEEYKRGSVGAARTSDPNSANSQFFICFGDKCRSLTGSYTLWGEVISGMENVDRIATGEPPPQPDTMRKVYILADGKK
jgi:peptidylprolyl isomerase